MNFLVLIVQEMHCMGYIDSFASFLLGVVIFHEYYNSFLKGTNKVVKFTGYLRHVFQEIYHYSANFYPISIKCRM